MNEDFRYIAAIAEHGSISKAARAQHISQPGLSQRLKRLETQLGSELFDRSSIPLKPTLTGEVYLKYARQALASEESLLREMGNAAGRRHRRLRIGVSMPRANTLLTKPIVEFYESHRGCTVELLEMKTLEQMHRLFLCDEVDFAVLTSLSPDPSMYDLEVLCHERLVVFVSDELRAPQLKRARAGRLRLNSLEGMPMVLPSCGEYYDPMIDRLLDLANVQLDIIVHHCSAELACALVKDGLGASICPSTWIAGMPGFRSFDLDDVQAGNVLRYVRRNDRPATSEEELFMGILRRHLAPP